MEGKGIVNIFTLLRSTGHNGRGSIGTYIETRSTTVSWKLRKLSKEYYKITNTSILKTCQSFGVEITLGIQKTN